MTDKKQIREFIEQLSSKAPTPGGGGASALAGALGCGLGLMVGNLTVGKKKYAQAEEEIRARMEELLRGRETFLALADQDEEAFEPLAKAYRLPAATEEERALKEQVMEERLFAASQAPLRMMAQAVELLEGLEVLGEKGSIMAASDVGVGAAMARSALTGAAMNVYINTKAMKDRDRAGALEREADRYLAEGCALADGIYSRVLGKLKG